MNQLFREKVLHAAPMQSWRVEPNRPQARNVPAFCSKVPVHGIVVVAVLLGHSLADRRLILTDLLNGMLTGEGWGSRRGLVSRQPRTEHISHTQWTLEVEI